VPALEPAPLPKKWEGLIGEYGPDHNRLTILEKDAVLHVLIEWVFLYPLTEVSENHYKFPDFGLYHGHPLVFHRDAAGQGTTVEAANYRFERRPLPRPGETFKLTPLRPIDELRKIALAAEPPRENNALLRKPDLVDITTLDSAIKLDIRYATENNVLGTPLYTSARAFLQRPAAEALVRVNKKLKKLGYGLLIHDAYRPWHVTKMFRDAVEPRFHHFVADPLQGSRHNRGCAVDLTLYERSTGKPVEMVGGYDEFTDRSYPDYVGGTSGQRQRRDLLRRVMEDEGFAVYSAEWWHFDFGEWRNYPILNATFEDLKE
jgi:D-alanyl-D-alanine dipeptidase